VCSIMGMIDRINDYGDDLAGKKVVVIGGGAVGLDVVEFFAKRGAQISIVEMMPIIGNGLDPVSKADTTTLMREHDVKQYVNTKLMEVCGDHFHVETPEGPEDLFFDYGFVCLGMKAYSPLVDAINEKYENTPVAVMNIGDSKRARRIIEGTEEGRAILDVLEKYDFR
ncbi:MAG: FAD-dependent oxidoreductase, partial [Eubacterium sp.]|nr:FAD-dependent oxidoreductase [Eubacterium sp.]